MGHHRSHATSLARTEPSIQKSTCVRIAPRAGLNVTSQANGYLREVHPRTFKTGHPGEALGERWTYSRRHHCVFYKGTRRVWPRCATLTQTSAGKPDKGPKVWAAGNLMRWTRGHPLSRCSYPPCSATKSGWTPRDPNLELATAARE